MCLVIKTIIIIKLLRSVKNIKKIMILNFV